MQNPKTTRQLVHDFFTAYENNFNDALTGEPDIEKTVMNFADCFVAANPLGVMCGKNDDSFRGGIFQGFQFYRSIGTKYVKIVSISVTTLDEVHAMAKVRWQTLCIKPDGGRESIDFEVIYLLQVLAGKPKIFAYITGDERKVLRERGLIPG